MGKDNKLLWVIAAVGMGWFLAPKEVKEQITGGVPSIGIDLSGLLGGGVGQAPLGFGGLTGGISEQWFVEWWEANKPPTPTEVPLLDYTGIIQDILDAGNTAAGVIGKAASDAANLTTGGSEQGGDVAPTPPTIPTPWDEFTMLHPVVKNVIAGVAGVGGVYGAVKGVQVLAPAARITTDAMARTFAAVLRGKPPIGGIKAVKPTIPWWGKTPLGKQWINKTTLGKVFGKGGQAGRVGVGVLGKTTLATLLTIPAWEGAKWLNYLIGGGTSGATRFIDQFLGISTLPGDTPDVTIPWTSKTWNLKPQPEGIYPKQPVPMRAEREYTPKEPKLTLTQKYGTPEIKQPLYKPPLEGVQW